MSLSFDCRYVDLYDGSPSTLEALYDIWKGKVAQRKWALNKHFILDCAHSFLRVGDVHMRNMDKYIDDIEKALLSDVESLFAEVNKGAGYEFCILAPRHLNAFGKQAYIFVAGEMISEKGPVNKIYTAVSRLMTAKITTLSVSDEIMLKFNRHDPKYAQRWFDRQIKSGNARPIPSC